MLRCGVLRYSVVRCGEDVCVLRCGVLRYSVVRCGVVRMCVVC